MASPPAYLRLSALEQRERFYQITEACENHVEEGMRGEPASPWALDAATLPQNNGRNRYLNVFPWDRTRVKLDPAVEHASNYINASWVELGRSRFIAAQGPLAATAHHFWAMCFNEAARQHSDVVVVGMVTPLVELGREKCAKYWPDKGEQWDMGPAMRRDGLAPPHLRVAWQSEHQHDDFLVTTLRLEADGEAKTVLHYFYLKWQDTRTPDSVEPLLALSAEISKVKLQAPELVPVIHCSAGVGRTGTFIAIDHFLNSDVLRGGSEDPVVDTVSQLRDARMMMVQTVHQFQFLYAVARRLYEQK